MSSRLIMEMADRAKLGDTEGKTFLCNALILHIRRDLACCLPFFSILIFFFGSCLVFGPP